MTVLIDPADRRFAAEAATWDALDALWVAARTYRSLARSERDPDEAARLRARGSSLMLAVSNETGRRLLLSAVAPALLPASVRAYTQDLRADGRLDRAMVAADTALGDRRWREMTSWRDVVRAYPRALRRTAWRAALAAVALEDAGVRS